MATQLWSPLSGLIGWRSQRYPGYDVTANLDGLSIYYYSDDCRTVERAFYRACRRTMLRRILPWLAPPARELHVVIHAPRNELDDEFEEQFEPGPLSITNQENHMPVWATIPVTDQPTLTLEHWSIYELPDGDRHFVGWAIENHEGRVSSRIEEFDVNTMSGVTSTGRTYKLEGPPGNDRDAAFTWSRWRSINNVVTFVDVSRAVWTEHKHSHAK